MWKDEYSHLCGQGLTAGGVQVVGKAGQMEGFCKDIWGGAMALAYLLYYKESALFYNYVFYKPQDVTVDKKPRDDVGQ
jgi:hypothetical protein